MELKVLDLSFFYNSVKILKKISLEVKSGEVLGIIGPNGAGKTTLLKCMNRKLNPRMGVVLIDGKDISETSRKEIAKNIGFVPQLSSVSFPFTVLDIVLMGRYSHTTPPLLAGAGILREREKDIFIAQQCLEITGIKHLSERFITEISGGEYQKVVIARALAQEPKVLLLDEPTLHLDISHQIEILNLVKNLARRKKLAVGMVLHDLNLAARYSDKILILKKGKIFASGLPEEVLNMKNIEEVYGIGVEISRSNKNGFLNIIPISARRQL